MSRLFAILVILLAAVPLVSAQPEFKPGFILTSNRDTLKGFILEKGRSFMNKHCVFRETPGAAKRDYAPGELAGYGYSGKFYSSQSITDKDQSTTYFVEELVHGRLVLFVFRREYYLVTAAGKVEHLSKVVKHYQVDGHEYAETIDAFRDILLENMGDCRSLRDQIKRAELGEKSLTSLVEAYNECGNPPVRSKTFRKNQPWLEATVGLEGGYITSRLHNLASQSISVFIDNKKFKQDDAYFFGISASFHSPRLTPKGALNVGVLFHQNTFASSNGNYSARWTSSTVRIPIGVSYALRRVEKKIVPFVELGMTYNSINNRQSSITDYGANYPIQASDWTLMIYGAAGVHWKVGRKLSLYAKIRYERGACAFNQSTYGVIVQDNYSAALGIAKSFSH